MVKFGVILSTYLQQTCVCEISFTAVQYWIRKMYKLPVGSDTDELRSYGCFF